MKRIHFFATKDDLLPLLDGVETKVPIKYIRMGPVSGRQAESYAAGIDLPGLGKATAESTIACSSYLVCRASQEVYLRAINLNNGTTRYDVDQLINPDSVVFSPGGLWSEDVLLSGTVATVSESNDAQELMRAFASQVRKHFRKVRAFGVGKNAMTLLEEGGRLTAAASSPTSYDLKLM